MPRRQGQSKRCSESNRGIPHRLPSPNAPATFLSARAKRVTADTSLGTRRACRRRSPSCLVRGRARTCSTFAVRRPYLACVSKIGRFRSQGLGTTALFAELLWRPQGSSRAASTATSSDLVACYHSSSKQIALRKTDHLSLKATAHHLPGPTNILVVKTVRYLRVVALETPDSDFQDSSARLRFWTKTLFRRGTMNAIIGVMSILSPPGRISTPRVNRVPSPAGSTV
jgi:hypothetical protein